MFLKLQLHLCLLQSADTVDFSFFLVEQSAPVEVTPCLCQQGEPERQEPRDKSTQTPWRAQKVSTLFISHPHVPVGSDFKLLTEQSAEKRDILEH